SSSSLNDQVLALATGKTQQEITAACKNARPNHVGAAIARHKRAGRVEERDGKRPWKNASAEDGGPTSAVRLRQGLRADPGTQARIACSSGPTPMMLITRLML